MENFTVQLADSPERLRRCLQIRTAVFTVEKMVPKEIEVDACDCLESTCDHFLIQSHGTDVGTIRCMHVSDNTIRVQRFCFLKEYRGLGLGKAVMRYIEDYYCRRKVIKIELDAKYEVYGFYEKCGYKRISDIFIEANIEHVKMLKEL